MTVHDAWDVLTLAATNLGDSIAYVHPGSQHACTYAQLFGQSNRLATWLHSQGVQRGDRIAVMLHNCVEAIQLHFAAAALHAIVVNINTHWIDREISLVLEDSAPELLFVHPQYLQTVQAAMESASTSGAVPPPTCSVNTLILVDSAATAAKSASQQPQTAYMPYSAIMADSNTDAILIRPSSLSEKDGYEMYYTSGTTGRPKGVVLNQHMVVQHALGTIQGRWQHTEQCAIAGWMLDHRI
ncbi:putative uncategorized biosynthetic cluster [Trebouxia sp. C0010 RCD-2024]